MEEVYIRPPFIKLEQFLKLCGFADTGGMAKNVISEGLVRVDGEVCVMRGKKLRGGEVVEVEEKKYRCVLADDS